MVLKNNSVCGVVLVLAMFGLAGSSTLAGDQNADKEKAGLAGVWKQTGGEMKIEFVDKDKMKIFPHGEEKILCITCEYTTEKNGLVKVKITELAGDARERAEKIVPVGLEFSFKWTAKDDSGKLEDVKGKEVEALKGHLEGKYDLKK